MRDEVTHRVDVFLAAESVIEAGKPSRQGEQRIAGGVQAGLVVVGHRERSGRPGPQRHLVLQLMHRGEVGGIVGIGEDPRCDQHVVGVETLHGELVVAALVEDVVDVVIVVDDHHRQVAGPGIGQRQRGTRGDVDDRAGVQRVTVLADHRLIIDGCWLTMVEQLVHPAPLGERREHSVGLGSDEVVDVDLCGHRRIIAGATRQRKRNRRRRAPNAQ